MSRLRFLLLLPVMGLPLGGCWNPATVFETAATTSVSPQTALVAVNAYDALVVVATGYNQLPNCSGSAVGVACHSTVAAAAIKKAVLAGRVTRNQIEGLLVANSGAAIPLASYNTLVAANSAIQGIYSQYNVPTK